MRTANRKWRYLLPVLLTGVLLRAFIPAGYMPAEPGKGLLFELCDAALPAGFTAELNRHGHHAEHTAHNVHDEHGADGDCSIGHILTLAFIDAVEIPDFPVTPPANVVAAVIAELRPVARQYAYAPRGPPIL